jgi:hypothetical protein
MAEVSSLKSRTQAPRPVTPFSVSTRSSGSVSTWSLYRRIDRR